MDAARVLDKADGERDGVQRSGVSARRERGGLSWSEPAAACCARAVARHLGGAVCAKYSAVNGELFEV